MGIGIVCHTLNPLRSPAHLASMIAQASNRVLVISPDLAELAEALVPLCTAVGHIVVLDEPGAETRLPNGGRIRVWRYGDLLEQHGEATSWGGFDETAPAGLCFTSGTTGAPKGVTYTHRSNYLHTLHQLQADVLGVTARDVLLVAVPMFHANGRSEEHTSELQSLMRISYAVFCLKKKKHSQDTNNRRKQYACKIQTMTSRYIITNVN